MTEAELAQQRKDAIDGLRAFSIDYLIAGVLTNTTVFAHRHALGPKGIVLFMTDTAEGSFVRTMFRDWIRVEELIKVDGTTSQRHDN